jgi:Putative lumazine-binding
MHVLATHAGFAEDGQTKTRQSWRRRTAWLFRHRLLVSNCKPMSTPTMPRTGPEHDAISAVLHTYFHAHATASAAEMRQVFWGSAHIEGHRAEGFVSWPLTQYSEAFKGVPAADESSRVRQVDWVDVVGDAAAAKATLQHGSVTFTDYFVLLKIDDQWRIANKVYHGARP